MQPLVRVLGAAAFAVLIGLSSVQGASASSGINVGATMVEFDNTLGGELLNAFHAVVRSVPVSF